MPHKRPQALRDAAGHRTQSRTVPHIPGLPSQAQQEISEIEIITAADWARTGFWPGAVGDALTGWSRTSYDPAHRHFHPCACCGRSSRTLLHHVLNALSANSAQALQNLITPLDEQFVDRTLPNPLAPSDLPWWETRI